jgi:hypothetical protein
MASLLEDGQRPKARFVPRQFVERDHEMQNINMSRNIAALKAVGEGSMATSEHRSERS